MVNRIEFNVSDAADFVETAREDTKKAVQYQSAARKVSVLFTNFCLFLKTRLRQQILLLHV